MANKRKRFEETPIELARQRWASSNPPAQLGTHRVQGRPGLPSRPDFAPLRRSNALDYDQRTYDQDDRSARPAKRPRVKRLKPAVERETGPNVVTPKFRVKANTKTSSPWVVKSPAAFAPDASWRLHTEIEQFFDFVKSHDYERRARASVISEIGRDCGLGSRNSGPTRVEPFGSFAMNLNLPTGDLDLVLIEPAFDDYDYQASKEQMKRTLSRYEGAIKRSPAFAVTNIIRFSRIPIIKIQHKATGLDVDLSFNNTGGIPAIELVKKWANDYVAMPPLVMIVKQILLMRDLNDVAYEGMGSFTIICLVTSYLMQHPKLRDPQTRHENTQYGELLLGFLQLYGTDFDRIHTGITMKLNSSSYFPKPFTKNGKDQDKFSVINPLSPYKDIASGTRRARDVAAVFEDARSKLEKTLKDHEASGRSQPPESLLSCIIGGDYTCYLEQRDKLKMYDGRVNSRTRGAPGTQM